ncbi:hypothetical protein C8T65DRAFT_800234 [Cerioporus squamosus]|nr:hypothetical protein C8T65DRAFT_800234 [Cerioporus squamosus]
MPSRKKAKRGGSSRRVPATHPSPNAQVPAAPSRRIRGKRGGLKDMPTLPLDVLVEIVSHMHPKDLLNMSRASRDFRSFLLNRTNAGLWRAARSNVPGLPDCPPFLSEPAYANLVFSFQCHVSTSESACPA